MLDCIFDSFNPLVTLIPVPVSYLMILNYANQCFIYGFIRVYEFVFHSWGAGQNLSWNS